MRGASRRRGEVRFGRSEVELLIASTPNNLARQDSETSNVSSHRGVEHMPRSQDTSVKRLSKGLLQTYSCLSGMASQRNTHWQVVMASRAAKWRQSPRA